MFVLKKNTQKWKKIIDKKFSFIRATQKVPGRKTNNDFYVFFQFLALVYPISLK